MSRKYQKQPAGLSPREPERRPATKVERARKLPNSGNLTPWYLGEEGKIGRLVTEHVDRLRRKELASYRSNVLNNMRLYAGSWSVTGQDGTVLTTHRVRYNVVKEAVDTGVAILTAARTLPFYQTRGADWKLRRKAYLLNQVIQQQSQDIGVFKHNSAAVTDALVGGLGVLKFFQDPDQPGGAQSCERRLPLTGVWDPAEAAAGSIRSYFEVEPIHREVLAEMFPEHADAISKAPPLSDIDRTDFQHRLAESNVDQVLITEAWHLPSSAEAGDGLHVWAINGTDCELKSEPWTLARLPFGFLKGWAPNQLGFTGVSIVDLVEPAQRRIEEMNAYIKRCQVKASGGKIFVNGASKVEPVEFTNEPWQLIPYEGPIAPTYVNVDGTPHDLEQGIRNVRNEVFEMLGFSDAQTKGETNPAITSAVGQKAQEDIQSKRHVTNLRHVEAWYLDCFQAQMDVNNQIAKLKPAFNIDRAVRNHWLETSKWNEIVVKEGEAKLAVLPVSQLVGSVSAQFDMAQTWVQAGWCTQDVAKMLAGHPDTEGQAEDDNEDAEFSHWLIDQVFDEKPVSLDPFVSPDVFANIARVEYLRCKRNKAPESVQTAMRKLLATAKDRIKAATPAPAPAAPQGPPVQLPQAA